MGAWAMSQDNKGDRNCAFGNDALKYNSKGSENVAVGRDALRANKNGSCNTAIGESANCWSSESNNSTAIGYWADTNGYDNSTAIGANSTVTGKNQLQLGDSNTDVYTYNGYHYNSDGRDKTDVRDTELGLDFIIKLRPVDFKWDKRIDYQELVILENGEDRPVKKKHVREHSQDGSKKRKRYHHGFIAQEVAALKKDFGGYQDHSINGGGDMHTLNYSELIAPMVKAIQEQQKIIDALKKEVTNLTSKLA